MTDLVRALSDPRAYPHDVDGVEVHHTHISTVFLAGAWAYKVKKPVSLGFVDYGTLERRRFFCDEEVRLNRRLAPDVYLGVVPIVRHPGEPGLVVGLEGPPGVEPGEGGEGREGSQVGEGDGVVEWAVRMKRLPPERTLAARLEAGDVGPADLVPLAEHLAAFHRRARRGPEVARYGRFEVVARNARDNLVQSRDHIGSTIRPAVFDRLSAALERALVAVHPQVAARASAGVPCATHGDLRLDHVYFLADDAPPTVIDCIEFNEAFRFADPVADIAFLAMDLQQAGRRDLARVFCDAWFRAADDEGGRILEPFYVAYRAAVRGKVKGIEAASDVVPADIRRRAARTARGHWLLALGLLEPPERRPGLVLVGGLPATGKSTLARAIAARADFTVVRSDAVRKELAGLPADAPAAAAWGEGLYTGAWSDRTYAACLRRTRERLEEGGRVVVDASFHAEDRRRAFVDLAVALGVRVALLVCEVAPDVARDRLESRGPDASDAHLDIQRRMRGAWEPPGPEAARLTTRISTATTPEQSVAAALDALRAAGLARAE